MSTHAIDYLDAVDHLPAGATLLLPHVSWEQYEQLLSELAGRPGLRLSYDRGKLEIMSPLPEHEEYKVLIHDIARILSEELGLDVEMRGSTTFRREREARGAEPDECFYVQHAAAIIGKRQIDLGVDPPPDVVVEIDTTNESLGKFPIYATLGVPEIWRYDGRQVSLYELSGETYREISASRAFPLVTSEVLSRFLEESKTEGQSAALYAFRQWVKTQRS